MTTLKRIVKRAGPHLFSHLIAPVIFAVVLGVAFYIVALIGCLAGAEDVMKFWGTDKTSCEALFWWRR